MTEPIHHSPTQDRSRAPGLPRTLVPPSFFNVPSAINDWHYESRRVAQSILPHLFLGPMSVVKDEKFIEENNIKLVLGTTSPQMWQIMKQRYAGRPQFQALPVAGTADLVKMFPKSKAIIDTTLQNEGAVLVYCETGNEISAAVVVAYIMETNKWDLIKSIQFVQSQRFCVALDDDIKFQLRTYESLCKAQDEVQAASSSDCERIGIRRTIDDLYEDTTTSSAREGMAPFSDSNPDYQNMTG
ncbi:protein-tyrosine phosphatase-like protein [Kockiozyma suomiensis]|uniref:protein-tyrosine phosphatase-like protein n=1 Tax=Kockiozyma suomiensis TaxID=1337062 RepID=UPI0033432456